MDSKIIERLGIIGVMSLGIAALNVERLRLVDELAEAREAQVELMSDFRNYGQAMAKALAGAVE